MNSNMIIDNSQPLGKLQQRQFDRSLVESCGIDFTLQTEPALYNPQQHNSRKVSQRIMCHQRPEVVPENFITSNSQRLQMEAQEQYESRIKVRGNFTKKKGIAKIEPRICAYDRYAQANEFRQPTPVAHYYRIPKVTKKIQHSFGRSRRFDYTHEMDSYVGPGSYDIQPNLQFLEQKSTIQSFKTANMLW